MSDEHRYHRTYITLTRLLNAPRFGTAVADVCREDADGEKFGAALVMSRDIWRQVVEPFHAALVPPARCGEIAVVTPDFADAAWIYFPGLDAETVLSTVASRAADLGPSGRQSNGIEAKSADRVPGVKFCG